MYFDNIPMPIKGLQTNLDYCTLYKLLKPIFSSQSIIALPFIFELWLYSAAWTSCPKLSYVPAIYDEPYCNSILHLGHAIACKKLEPTVWWWLSPFNKNIYLISKRKQITVLNWWSIGQVIFIRWCLSVNRFPVYEVWLHAYKAKK